MYPNAPTPNPAGGSYPYQGATVAYRPPKRRSAIKIVFAIFAALVAALLGSKETGVDARQIRIRRDVAGHRRCVAAKTLD